MVRTRGKSKELSKADSMVLRMGCWMVVSWESLRDSLSELKMETT